MTLSSSGCWALRCSGALGGVALTRCCVYWSAKRTSRVLGTLGVLGVLRLSATGELPKCMHEPTTPTNIAKVLCYTPCSASSLLACGSKLRLTVRKAFTCIERGYKANWQSPSSPNFCWTVKPTGVEYEVIFLLIQSTSEGVFRVDDTPPFFRC